MMTHSSFFNSYQNNIFKNLEIDPKEKIFLEKVEKIIQNNLANQNFSVVILATKVHLSVSQLNRKLNNIIQKPAGQLIRSIRMNYAAKLIRHDFITIGEIAYKVGYSTHTHFSRSFKREFGCVPSEYFNKEIRMRKNGHIMRNLG